jgi:hypothetical protein
VAVAAGEGRRGRRRDQSCDQKHRAHAVLLGTGAPASAQGPLMVNEPYSLTFPSACARPFNRSAKSSLLRAPGYPPIEIRPIGTHIEAVAIDLRRTRAGRPHTKSLGRGLWR